MSSPRERKQLVLLQGEELGSGGYVGIFPYPEGLALTIQTSQGIVYRAIEQNSCRAVALKKSRVSSKVKRSGL